MRADRRGVTAVLTAVILLSLMATVGVAVDGARFAMAQSRLRTATDAAALAAARDMATATAAQTTQTGTDMFWANFGRSQANSTSGFLGTNVSSVTVAQASASTVSVQASGLLPTTFMNLAGIPAIPVSSLSQATIGATGLELALVMDNTGSMAGWPIQAVITSANELVNILYNNGTADTEPNLWISVVPFTAEVDIGPGHTDWLAPGSNTTSNYMNTSWMGCVMARYDSVDPATGLTNDFTDVPPGGAPFQPYLYPSTFGKYTVKDRQGKTLYFGDNDWTPTHITESQQNTLPGNTAVGPNLGCPQTTTGTGLAILPLNPSRTAVLSVVNQMVANYRGGTFINLGLQAGWWTLSPRWRGTAGWGNPTLPLDYHTQGMTKVIVLMTDGNNQWYDWPGGAPGAAPAAVGSPPAPTGWANDGNTDFTGYGRLLDNDMKLPAGQNTQANATTNINNRMSQMCTLIKQNGIVIYTILFDHDGTVTNSTEALFQNCATDARHYFLDVTSEQLQATFSTIGQQVSSLRISR